MSDQRMIGPYRVEGELGGGGMGVVYHATGPGGVEVAIKVIRSWLATPEVQRRFEREAEIRIDHPNVVRVLETGMDPILQSTYVVLELLSGESLEQRLARGPMEAREVVALGVQACRGVAAAHALGIIHRDLKPSNLFLCRDGTVKILDFGIALLTTRETRITSEGGVLGTPAYMSPEQIQGYVALDTRTDVWSLGAALYEALSGRPPFVRETPLALMLAVLMEEPEPLWSRAPEVPEALCSVIGKALAKRPELRWASATELGEALLAVPLPAIIAEAPMDRPPVDAEADNTLTSIQPPPLSLIPPGEHRIVAVLLAEAVHDLTALGAAVREHGGTIAPLFGRRAIGLFGAETWEGDEVARAASAALAARGAAERMAVASGRAMSSGGGISGDVLCAAEVGCAAGLRGVAVDAATARSLEDTFVVREALTTATEAEGGGAAPGGDAAALWEIAGRKPLDSRRWRGTERDPPLLGRDAELAQLQAGLRRVLEEQHHVVLLITGPPGIGKTRLRREIEVQLTALAEPVVVLSAWAEPLQRESAMALIGAALRSHPALEVILQEEEGSDPGGRAAARRAAVTLLAEEAIAEEEAAREHAQFLGELLGVPMPETPALRAARADPQLMMDRLRLALLDYMEGLAGRGVIALLLEDLQWADGASLAFLDDLLDRLADAPLLVLATARPELLEAQPSLFAGRNTVRVEPRGLISSDVSRMAAWIAGRPLPDALARAIAERTAGHPLFVEQIVLELRDRDLLDGRVEQLPMTPTVEAAAQSRLDHLPPVEKEACKRAAVLGRPFTAEELEAMGVAGAAQVLGSLGRRDLLTGRARAGGARGRQFQFRSALVADVAYGMIADSTRRELHCRAALHLSAQAHADDEEIASHFERGGEPARAAARYASAALAAAPRGDTPTVLRCSERALTLGVQRELQFALHMARADALRFLGRRDEQGRELSLSRDLATSDADLARVLTDLAMYAARAGRSTEAVATSEAAVEAAERAGDADALTVARGMLVGALVYDGKLARAREAFVQALQASSAAAPRARAILAGWRAHLATALGDHGERREAFEAAIALYREVGDLRRVASAEVNLADAYNRVGAYAEAESALRQALEGCRRLNSRISEGYALANLGYALSMQGKTNEALESLGGAIAIATAASEVRLCLWARAYRARARLAVEAPAEVAADAEQVADEAAGVGDRAAAVVARTIAARARLAAGDAAGALRASTLAMAALDELGGIEEGEAELFVVHAQALDAAGRPDEAVATRRRGSARARETAERIRDPAWQRRFLGDVAANRELMSD